MKITSVAQLVEAANARGCSIAEVVIAEEARVSGSQPSQVMDRMVGVLQVMRAAVERGLSGEVRSRSGLTGGDAARVWGTNRSLAGETINHAISRALAVSEVNAGMGKIVAAPTAGSSGVLPGVILTIGEQLGADETTMARALFTAAGIGLAIGAQATLSGAEGGCQAECGSAAAMAAAAAVEMAGGTPEQAAQAAAFALKSSLGLVCDPVAGLVEIPCVKRNALSAVNALAAAEMALAGVKSAIPADEVIQAMGEVGRMLPEALRETARGGLAQTPTGRRIAEEVMGRNSGGQ